MSLFRQRPRKPAPLKVRRAAYLASRNITDQRPLVGRWVNATSQPPRLYEVPRDGGYGPWGYRYGRWPAMPWTTPPQGPPPYMPYVHHQHQHEHVHDLGLGFGTGFGVAMGWMTARIVLVLVLCTLLVTVLVGASRVLLP